jgi:cytosine/adenosine deaminase-related metal-dependent hydrolase
MNKNPKRARQLLTLCSEIIPRGRIGIDDQGQILFVAKTFQEKDESVKTYGYSPSVAITDLGDKFMIPGFIDTHTHAPQYVFTGHLLRTLSN